MTFSARQTLSDLNLEPFPFEGMDGKIYHLPHLKGLSLDDADRIDQGGHLEVLEALVPDAVAQMRTIPVGVIEPMIVAWFAHSEAKSGESAASSDSGATTAGPSKQTSRATTKSKTPAR